MDLYIIGAGDIGGYIAHHLFQMSDYKLRGFLDDDSSKIGRMMYGVAVIDSLDFLQHVERETAVVVAVANPVQKKNIITKVSQNPLLKFPSFIHPTVWRGIDVTVGKGVIIYPGVTINYETVIEDFVTINMNATIGHNCYLSKYVTLSPGVNCGGYTRVGEESFLGIGSNILQSIHIGSKSTVGAGSVIIRDVPDGATVVGNPGRVLKN